MAKKDISSKVKKIEKDGSSLRSFPPRLIKAMADEVAKTVVERLPRLIRRNRRKSQGLQKKLLKNAFFLDTSAIVDGRIFDVINIGLISGVFVVLESVLLELKHIADSQDSVKRLRGRKGLDLLEKLKKTKSVKLHTLEDRQEKKEVDERLLSHAKGHKGKIITCDYNLEKKAAISGILAINMNSVANALKVTAVPGEALYIKILHVGKDASQGVGYLDDGTMVVVEKASNYLDRSVDVMVSRVIQTPAGRILFARKI